MRPRIFSTDVLLEAFYSQKILTKTEALEINHCSTMTLWRMLKNHGYYTSYNCNAAYYTLADIPVFDEHGLWAYRQVRFSKYGSLYQTVVALVTVSGSGLNAAELGRTMGINVLPALTLLHRQGRLARQKMDQVFCYLSPEEQRHQVQWAERQRLCQKMLEQSHLPEPTMIIAVLIELIKNNRLSSLQIHQRLSRQGLSLSPQQIDEIVTYYDLHRKKKPTF
jgi:hypothetical protein